MAFLPIWLKDNPPVRFASFTKIFSPIKEFLRSVGLIVKITAPALNTSEAASSRVIWLRLSSPSLIRTNTRRVGFRPVQLHCRIDGLRRLGVVLRAVVDLHSILLLCAGHGKSGDKDRQNKDCKALHPHVIPRS